VIERERVAAGRRGEEEKEEEGEEENLEVIPAMGLVG
jgi:hypothetical protein